MIRTTFSIDELRTRERIHRENAKARTAVLSWNQSPDVVENANCNYRRTQLALADMFAELIQYRRTDDNYNEVGE